MEDKATLREALERAVESSKIPAFFSFHEPFASDQMVGRIVRSPSFVVFELKVDPKTVSSAILALPLLKTVLEHFRKMANRLLPWDGYPNVSFTSASVNGTKIPACVLLFTGKASDGAVKPWYRTLSAPCLTLDTVKTEGSEIVGKGYSDEAERVFARMLELLKKKDFSVRKVFALWMKQWQSRILYAKTESLGLFRIDPEDQNRKTYFPENFGLLTLETVREVLESERP